MATTTRAGSPLTDMSRRAGSLPVAVLDAWSRTGVAVANWSIPGPRQFSFGRRVEHLLSVALSPLARHVVWMEGRERRDGPVRAGRFRLGQSDVDTETDIVGAERIDMLHLYVSPKQFDVLLRPVGIEAGALELQDPLWEKEDALISSMANTLVQTIAGRHAMDQLCADQMSLALGLHVLRTYSNVGSMLPAHKGGLAAWRLRRVLDRMSDGLGERLTIAELAAIADYSPAHFCHAFKASTGLSPHAFLMRRRAETARRLLTAGDRPLHDIARACGFADQPHMNGVFRKLFGTTPKRLRDAAARD